MSYLVLARKWRPNNFDEMVGQHQVTQTLKNAITMDRVAHAFLFSGVRGVGKTSLARILAKALNCAEGPTVKPCGECESCKAISGGTAVDVIEIDGASNNSVDDIRELRDTVPYRPALGRYKIYVIDEVHMLSTSAFNALLKTLEEPPPHVKFIFATTEPHKIPVTILSRCQRYDFRRIAGAAIAERLQLILDAEQIAAEGSALTLISREAEGSMRDALSILDQVLAAGYREITELKVAELLGVADRQIYFDLSGALLQGQAGRCLAIVRDVDHHGYDIPTFAKGFLEHLRNLVVTGVCRGEGVARDLPGEERQALLDQAGTVSIDTLHRLFKAFAEAYETIARTSQPKIMLEASLARIADLGELVPAAELCRRLEALAASGGPAISSGGGGGGQGQNQSIGKPVRGNPTAGRPRDTAPTDTPPPPQKTSPSTRTPTPSNPSTSAPPPTASVEPAETAPSPPPATVESSWDPSKWPLFLTWLKDRKPRLASMLEFGTVMQNGSTQVLKIAFADDYAALAQLSQDQTGEIVECLNAFCGLSMKVQIVVDQGVGVPAATQRRIDDETLAQERKEEARQHPLVRQAISEFGGSVRDVRVLKS